MSKRYYQLVRIQDIGVSCSCCGYLLPLYSQAYAYIRQGIPQDFACPRCLDIARESGHAVPDFLHVPTEEPFNPRSRRANPFDT